MRNIVLILSVLAISLLVSGCGVTTSAIGTNQNVTQTNVNLSSSNFRIIGDVSGQASAYYVFGIGGLSKKALISNATADLYKNANLSGSQAVVNVTINQKHMGCAPFYIKRVIIAYGQIVEFK